MIDIMKQGLGAPHAPTRALRKLTRVEEFLVGGTGLEQHGTAAGGATNTPVGCLLVRGSQRLGMSTKKDAARPFGLGAFFVVDGTGLEQQRRRPPPAAETGSRGWDSVLIFSKPCQGG